MFNLNKSNYIYSFNIYNIHLMNIVNNYYNNRNDKNLLYKEAIV